MRLAVLVLALLPAVAAAEIYRWVDESGQVHYTETPPPAARAESVAPAPPPSSAPNQEALVKSLEQGRKDAVEREKQQQKAAAERAERQSACKHAREQLAYLQSRTARRLAIEDEQGNVSRMTDEEFQRRVAAEQAKIGENCG